MIYAITKAAHLVSLFVWIGGMVAVAISLRFPALAFMERLKAYDRAVTTPAMVLALGFGILLAVQGDWFTESWMGMKLLVVLILAGLHGALAGRLRRATKGPRETEACGQFFMLLGLLLVTLIVLLVTIKP